MSEAKTADWKHASWTGAEAARRAADANLVFARNWNGMHRRLPLPED